MTVAVIVAGLVPLFIGTGAGSEVMQRIAAPDDRRHDHRAATVNGRFAGSLSTDAAQKRTRTADCGNLSLPKLLPRPIPLNLSASTNRKARIARGLFHTAFVRQIRPWSETADPRARCPEGRRHWPWPCAPFTSTVNHFCISCSGCRRARRACAWGGSRRVTKGRRRCG